MEKQFNFFKVALSDSRVGALSRSSKYVVQSVMENLEGQSLNRVIEYGPGDGILTREILKKMPVDGEFIVAEPNFKFVKVLENIGDSRLKIMHSSAQQASREFKNTKEFDLVISSIPFSQLKPFEREQIVEDAFNMLTSSGKLIIFHQYSTIMFKLLKKYFGESSIKSHFELRNIPPCFIMSARKTKKILCYDSQ